MHTLLSISTLPWTIPALLLLLFFGTMFAAWVTKGRILLFVMLLTAGAAQIHVPKFQIGEIPISSFKLWPLVLFAYIMVAVVMHFHRRPRPRFTSVHHLSNETLQIRANVHPGTHHLRRGKDSSLVYSGKHPQR